MAQAHTTQAKAHHSSGQHTPSLVLVSVSLELDAPGQSHATRTTNPRRDGRLADGQGSGDRLTGERRGARPQGRPAHRRLGGHLQLAGTDPHCDLGFRCSYLIFVY